MAKFTMIPGDYAAGASIPLTGTVCGCGGIYHEDGSSVIQVKGSGCPLRVNRYFVGVGATMTAVGTAPETLALLQDGVRVTGGLLSIDAAAAGEQVTTSVPNEIGAVTSASLTVEAVTAVTITEGAVIVIKE